ncbi:hypothetical protein [Agrococcus jejuensis]|uniref:WXG100-like domain-containing protein n=1 Tax=Agrococcus jejuensis TaxID=399736 RepID=UPI0011A3CBE9|nr:hypothetical protein [Agrococcus jejuensis]
MALNIPSELAFVLNLLGFDWPELDEDEIHRAAHIMRQFSDDIQGTMDEVGARVTGDVPSAVTANAASSYSEAWEESQSSMGEFCELIDGAATGVDLAADAVLALKLKVIAELVITAAQLAAATAAAFATFGLAAAAQPAIILARKKIMDIIVGEMVAAAVIQIITLVQDPLTDVLESVLDEILDAPVVSSAVGQVEEYQTDYAALEQASRDMDRSAREQERLGEDFMAQIMSLQISTAG